MIPALAARMREIVTAEPHAPHASCTREAGPLFLHLTRHGCDFALELNNEASIPVAAAHTWAKACGAPEGTPILSMADGRIHRAEWQEEGFEPASAASRAFYLGGKP